MAHKLKILFYLFLLSMSFMQACVSQPAAIKRNQYGLQVVRKGSTYQQTIQTDTNKRMIAVKKYVQPLTIEWKYATKDNFTKTILYKHPQAYVRLPAAKALQNVQNELKIVGLGLKFFDAYRPYHVTQQMWKAVPDDRYAANPAKGSGHNRGAAVDVTLIDLTTGKELEMPTAFDDFTEKAHHNYSALAANVLKNRALLKETMEKHGFIALDTEWWHYYLPKAAERFELLDLGFNQLKRLTKNY
jgi:D-alanyl-D-alanine dipeptidase